MKQLTRWTTPVALACLIYVVYTRDAHAYLDPGTGSYILQLAIAFLLATLFFIKIQWSKIKRFVSSRLVKKNDHAR